MEYSLILLYYTIPHHHLSQDLHRQRFGANLIHPCLHALFPELLVYVPCYPNYIDLFVLFVVDHISSGIDLLVATRGVEELSDLFCSLDPIDFSHFEIGKNDFVPDVAFV